MVSGQIRGRDGRFEPARQSSIKSIIRSPASSGQIARAAPYALRAEPRNVSFEFGHPHASSYFICTSSSLRSSAGRLCREGIRCLKTDRILDQIGRYEPRVDRFGSISIDSCLDSDTADRHGPYRPAHAAQRAVDRPPKQAGKNKRNAEKEVVDAVDCFISELNSLCSGSSRGRARHSTQKNNRHGHPAPPQNHHRSPLHLALSIDPDSPFLAIFIGGPKPSQLTETATEKSGRPVRKKRAQENGPLQV